jgi:hypothetical protein
MSSSVKVLESKEVKTNLLGEALYDSSSFRLSYRITNQRTVPVEVRVQWTALSNLEVADVDVDTPALSGADALGRTVLQPGEAQVCAVLRTIDRAAGFSYSYRVLATETVTTLPAVSRVIERTEIRPGVVIVAHWYGSLRQMHLLLINKRPSHVRLKIVWTAFENMRVLQGAGGEVFVAANSEELYAVMAPRDRDKAWKYRYAFRMVENAQVPTSAGEEQKDAQSTEQALGALQEALALFKTANGGGGGASGQGGEADAATVDPATLEKVCEEQKISFVDLEFPPSDGSLLGPGACAKREAQLVATAASAVAQGFHLSASSPAAGAVAAEALLHPKLRGATWRRISEILGADHCTLLKASELEPRAVRAGAAESSWLPATLAALAERGELIQRLFASKQPSATQRYSLYVCDTSGQRTLVTVDDFVPYMPLAGPLFTRNHGNDMWAALVTKAFAKCIGSYASLMVRLPHELMHFVTGCPVEALPLRVRGAAANELWARMSEWTLQGFVMVAASDKVDPSATGLLPRSHYTVLGVLPPQQPSDPQLVVLRSALEPAATWTGAWSAKSALWAQPEYAHIRALEPVTRVLDAAAQGGATGGSDSGEFIMPFSDFCQHFRMLSVCFYRRDWQEIRIPTQFLRHPTPLPVSELSDFPDAPSSKLVEYTTQFYLLEVPAATSLFAALHQQEGSHGFFSASVLVCKAVPNPAYAPPIGGALSPAAMAAEVPKMYDLGEVVADSSCLLSRYNHAECHGLEPGTYFIFPYSTGPVPAAVQGAAASEVAASAPPASQPVLLSLHALCALKVMAFPFNATLLEDAVIASTKKHGVTVNCNVPGLTLYDWCAKKCAYFALEMTEDFVKATGKHAISFKHELTLMENLQDLCGSLVEVPLRAGQRIFLNAAVVIHAHKAWKYKHRWEFLYAGATSAVSASVEG